LSPQLPIEGLIARAGGFPGVAAAEPTRIAYYKLNGRDEGGKLYECTEWKREGRLVTLSETLTVTEGRVRDLVAHFAKPETDYPSNKIPKAGRRYPGDYDHLARIAEWIATDSEDDDDRPF
jgi:ATP-dependent helicase/nuclease subunit B